MHLKNRRELRTVTRDHWGVSVETGSAYRGAILHTYRFHGPNGRLMQKGEGYGRHFDTSDAAWAWALEHGYIEPYVIPTCDRCRIQHRLHYGKGRTSWCDVREAFVSTSPRGRLDACLACEGEGVVAVATTAAGDDIIGTCSRCRGRGTILDPRTARRAIAGMADALMTMVAAPSTDPYPHECPCCHLRHNTKFNAHWCCLDGNCP